VPPNAFVLWLQNIEKFMGMGMDMWVSCKGFCGFRFLISLYNSR